jgi:hypothetical protein
MSDIVTTESVHDAHDLLEELFQEVSSEEGHLAGGIELGIGGSALQSLRETKVTFGNPKNNLVRLNEELFQKIGLELSPIHQQQMATYNFYYMTLAASMQPGPGTQFTRVECKVDLGPKGDAEPIVQTIFPTSEWRELLKSGVDMTLGLDGNLNWKAGIPDVSAIAGLPGSIKGDVSSNNELKAYVTIPKYSFELGRSDITAVGEENSECFWRIDNTDLKKAQTVQFGMVFKVPKAVKTLELSGLVVVEPNFGWLTANLSDVFEALSEKLQQFLLKKDDDRQGKDRLRLGAHEMWILDLPGE